MSPDELIASATLMKYGEYDESACSVEWLGVDASEAARAAAQGPEAVMAALLDTCWWDADSETRDRARAAADEIVAALGGSPTEDPQPDE